MPLRPQPAYLIGRRRTLQLAVAMCATCLLATGCGHSSPGPAPSTTTPPAHHSRPARSRARPGPLAFAACMRAHGVPRFPDPSANGTFDLGTAVNPSAPAFQLAQAKCHKLLGTGLLPHQGAPPSARTLAKLRRIAVCMRSHGVPQFPDPRTTMPSNVSPGQYQEITDFDGAILLFPASLNLQAPAYRHALTSCGAPPLGLPH